jgi:beta-hydroxylase
MKASATQNIETEKVGLLNRLFARLYRVRIYSKKIKRWNKSVYYGLKYTLFFLIVYALFLR